MKRYIFAGLLVFLIVLIVGFPARVAYNWFAPPEVKLTGITGSIWKGNAAEALAAGAYVRNIVWTAKPASILTGKFAFDISAEPAAGNIDANVAVGLDGALVITDLTGTLPLDLIHQAFQQEGIRGDVALNFSKLIVRNGLPVDVNGSVTIASLFAPNLSAVKLGDFRADFQTVDDSVTGSVDDLAGVLDVAGVITLNADKSYSLIGNVAARPSAPPSINQQLQFLGSPDERGFREFRFEGSL